jgi:hypothetical protein
MDANERLVRDTWERVLVCDGSYRHYAKGTILINWANHCFYEFNEWSAAAEFTRARLEQIRQVEEEIEWLDDCAEFDKNATWVRIEAREQAALTELKKGLKG